MAGMADGKRGVTLGATADKASIATVDGAGNRVGANAAALAAIVRVAGAFREIVLVVDKMTWIEVADREWAEIAVPA